MKQQISQLIDRLASKELTFGCKIKNKRFGYERIVAFSDDAGSYGGNVAYVPKPDEYVTGDQMDNYKDGKFEILGHPIHLHDMLEKMKGDEHYWMTYAGGLIEPLKYSEDIGISSRDMIVELWGRCGFTKSLQSIFEEAEWVCGACLDKYPAHDYCNAESAQIKQPHIRKLFQFLLQLGL